MYPMKHCVVVIFLACLVVAGCQSAGFKTGFGLSTGAARGLEESELDEFAHDLGENVGKGAKEGLLSDDTKRRLGEQADAVLTKLNERLPETAGAVRDELLGEPTRRQVRQLQSQLEDTLAQLEETSGRLREQLLGEHTQARVAALRDTLLGNESLEWVRDARDALLGDEFARQTRAAGRELVEGIGEGYDTALGPKLEDTISKINGILLEAKDTVDEWAIGFVVALLGGVGSAIHLVRKAGLHKKTLQILTAEINKIPSPREYDKLVSRIRQESARSGLRGHLTGILQEQGLIDQPEWQDRNRKLVEVLAGYVRGLQEAEADSVVAKLRDLAHDQGLKMADLPVR